MFAEAQVHKSGSQLHVTHGDDTQCYVEFYMEAVHLPADSEKAGHPIYRDEPFITIMFPGDKTKKVVRPVNDQDKQRFSRQWSAFEKQGIAVQEGTPITEWSVLTKSQALEMKGIGIHTVEQLSNVSDTNLTWFGAREIREKAKAWLDSARDQGAVVTKLMAEIAALRADLDASKEAKTRTKAKTE